MLLLLLDGDLDGRGSGLGRDRLLADGDQPDEDDAEHEVEDDLRDLATHYCGQFLMMITATMVAMIMPI